MRNLASETCVIVLKVAGSPGGAEVHDAPCVDLPTSLVTRPLCQIDCRLY